MTLAKKINVDKQENKMDSFWNATMVLIEESKLAFDIFYYEQNCILRKVWLNSRVNISKKYFFERKLSLRRKILFCCNPNLYWKEPFSSSILY